MSYRPRFIELNAKGNDYKLRERYGLQDIGLEPCIGGFRRDGMHHNSFLRTLDRIRYYSKVDFPCIYCGLC
jgi:hypothetical protein